MANPQKQSTAKALARSGGQDPNPAGRKKDDDTLIVPKGISRLQYMLLIGLMIFLLVIWLVPNAMYGITGKGGATNPVFVRWERPGHGTVEWTASEVMGQERALSDSMGFDLSGLSQSLGISAQQPKTEEFARVLVLDQLARDAGVEITNADLAAHLRQSFAIYKMYNQGQEFTDADFKNLVRARSVDQTTVEESIRLLLRVQRFLQLTGFAGAVPDPQQIEKQWHDENAEFAFDYATLAVADMKEEARKELPDEAGLKTWFEALSDPEKEELKTAEKRKGELALFRSIEKTPATALVKDFPEPVAGAQPTTPEELATQYYQRVFVTRFAKPTPEGADPKTTPPDFVHQEDIKDQCLAEAPVYFALQRWIEALNARKQKGETIDLAAEAAMYGLEYQPLADALTRDQFLALPDLGKAQLADPLFFGPTDGSFDTTPVPLPQGIFVVRATESLAPALPPFEEIRDKVADKWLEPKAKELAEARLAKLRDSFEEFTPEKKADEPEPTAQEKEAHRRATAEAFRAALEGAGLALKTRDYLNRAGPADKDPLAADEEHKTLFQTARYFGLYDLAADEVARPGTSFDGKTVFLVRLAGKREIGLENMSPTQYERYKRSARQSAIMSVGKTMDLEFLKKNYGLWLKDESAASHAGAAKGAPKDDEE